MNHEKIIEALGGYKLLAEKLDLVETTVFKWRKGGIPTLRWTQVVDIAKKNKDMRDKITLDTLARGAPKKMTLSRVR